jgi:hypothetical protein
MFRRIAALILVAALSAAWSYGDARVVHPVLNASAGGGDAGRRLFGPVACSECVALCQQVAITGHIWIAACQHMYICIRVYELHGVYIRADSLQNAVLHDGDAARCHDAAAAAGRVPAHHDHEGSDGGDEAGPSDPVVSRAGHGDGVLARVVQGELRVAGGLAAERAEDARQRRGQRRRHVGAVGGGHLLHRLRGHLRRAARAPLAHTRGAATRQPPR